MNVNAIHQGTGYPGPVSLDLDIGTAAFPLEISKETAGTGIHGRH